jgi:hypothetical protein
MAIDPNRGLERSLLLAANPGFAAPLALGSQAPLALEQADGLDRHGEGAAGGFV